MSRTAKALTVKGVEALKKEGRYAAGNKLWLQVRVSPKGVITRSWLVRYVLDGKACSVGLGPYPVIGLAEAGAKRDALLRGLRQGINPAAAKHAAAAAERAEKQELTTFRIAAEGYIAAHQAGWKNEKHRQQWTNTLEFWVYPTLGERPVAAIVRDDILRVLRQDVAHDGEGPQPFWNCRPETASRVRGRIERILASALPEDARNPADWRLLRPHLPAANVMKRANGQRSQPALPWGRVPAFMAALKHQGGFGARALEIVILTAARSGEVRGMTWGEVDLDAATWIVPGARMKAGKLHRQPLSGPAVELLRAMPRRSSDPAELVFPGAKGTLSDMTLSAVVRRMTDQNPRWVDETGQAVVPHGFRSSFRDWVSENTTLPGAIAEAQLAHTLRNKVEAAYSRTDHLEPRRKMMESWAGHCLSAGEQPPAEAEAA